MKRYAILTSTNRFPWLGEGASLLGCDNDTSFSLHTVIKNTKIFPGGFDKIWALTDKNDNSEHVLDVLAKAISELVDGDQLVGPWNSSHGTHYLDYLTGQQVSCSVCYNSVFGQPKTFISKLSYKRAFDKLKDGVRVWTRFDSCESGNMGQGFKLVDMATSERGNRWIAPPAELHEEIQRAPNLPVYIPKQVCTLAGCAELPPNNTCADIHDANPHGLFARSMDNNMMKAPTLSWYALATALNVQWAGSREAQRCVPNGPDWVLGAVA